MILKPRMALKHRKGQLTQLGHKAPERRKDLMHHMRQESHMRPEFHTPPEHHTLRRHRKDQ